MGSILVIQHSPFPKPVPPPVIKAVLPAKVFSGNITFRLALKSSSLPYRRVVLKLAFICKVKTLL
jgi:hypothetical protein